MSKELREALRQIAMGEPRPTDEDIAEGIYPMLNRTHEVHLYQRIAQRALDQEVTQSKFVNHGQGPHTTVDETKCSCAACEKKSPGEPHRRTIGELDKGWD